MSSEARCITSVPMQSPPRGSRGQTLRPQEQAEAQQLLQHAKDETGPRSEDAADGPGSQRPVGGDSAGGLDEAIMSAAAAYPTAQASSGASHDAR